MEKSANKRWKESGTSLSFKEWIDRENKKSESNSNFLPFESKIQDEIEQTIKGEVKTNYKPTPSSNKVFGLDKGVLVFSGILVVGSLGIYFYKKLKAKK